MVGLKKRVRVQKVVSSNLTAPTRLRRRRFAFSGYGGQSPASITNAYLFAMYFVCILQSEARPDKTCVGFTEDLKRRLDEHNSGSQTYFQ